MHHRRAAINLARAPLRSTGQRTSANWSHSMFLVRLLVTSLSQTVSVAAHPIYIRIQYNYTHTPVRNSSRWSDEHVRISF